MTQYPTYAVIDVGSNSIRLSLYECWPYLPHLIYSERAFISLADAMDGVNINSTQYNATLQLMTRFNVRFLHDNINHIAIFATSAMRDAANGAQLANDIEQILGVSIMIIDGEKEAYYAALSICATFDKPHGLVLDLGGGSLEIINVQHGRIDTMVSFPFGVLRARHHKIEDIQHHIQQFITTHSLSLNNIYVIGGTWRNLARLYMHYYKYPLYSLHNFIISRQKMVEFLAMITKNMDNVINECADILEQRRLTLLPDMVYICQLLCGIFKNQYYIFSSSSVSDGVLYDLYYKNHPYIPAIKASALKLRHADIQHYNKHIYEQIRVLVYYYQQSHDGFMVRDDILETLVFLKDISLYKHPDYRAIHAFHAILESYLTGINHQEKLFMAYSLFFKYSKPKVAVDTALYNSIINDDIINMAKIVGYMLRFFYIISAYHGDDDPPLCYNTINDNQWRISLPPAIKTHLNVKEHNLLKKIKHILNLPCSIDNL